MKQKYSEKAPKISLESCLMQKISCPGCAAVLEVPADGLARRLLCGRCDCKFIPGNPPEILQPPRQSAAAAPAAAAAREEPAAPAAPRPAARRAAAPPQRSSKGGLLIGGGIALALIGAAAAWHFSRGGQPAGAAGAGSPASRPGETPQLAAIDIAENLRDAANIEVKRLVSGIPLHGWRKAPPPQVDDAFVQALAGESSEQLVARLRQELGASLKDKAALEKGAASALAALPAMRHEILRLCGPQGIEELRARPEGTLFLQHFLGSPDWLEDFLTATHFGEREERLPALHKLATLFRYDKRCTLPLYRKLATAYALYDWADWKDSRTQWSLVDCYQTQLKMHAEGRMHAGFDKLESWEMMFVASPDIVDRHTGDRRALLDFALSRHCPAGAYDGACWEIPWVGDNLFGDSCQEGIYYSCWQNDYVRGAPSTKKVWGVCGTLSHYGAFNARAHGVPSFPVGQPGHCAYMLRPEPGTWWTPYSVTWPTSAGTHFGGADESTVRLLEAAYSNARRPALLRAQRHLWQRRFLAGSVALSPTGQASLFSEDGNRGKSCEALASLKPASQKQLPLNQFAKAALDQPGAWRGGVWEGEFTLAEAGEVFLGVSSDDGSRIYLDGELAVDNDGAHGDQWREAVRRLAAGKHRLKVEYFDMGGGRSLRVEVRQLPAAGPARLLARQALELQLGLTPLDLHAWKARADELAADADEPQAWFDFARAYSRQLRDFPHMALLFAEREFFAAAQKAIPAQQRHEFLARLHEGLDPRSQQAPIGGHFDGHLNAAAAFLGNEEAEARHLATLIDHYRVNPNDLSPLLATAAARFLPAPRLSPIVMPAVSRALKEAGGNAPAALSGMLVEAGNKESFSTWKALFQAAPSILGQADFREVSPRVKDNYPKTASYPGRLLSGDGLLRLSSHYDQKHVLSFPAALSQPQGGFIHTGNEVRPWAEVVLPGPCQLSGISIVNRFEDSSYRALPLKVAVSEDGKTWTEVFRSDKDLACWEIDLAKKPVRARYVRISRDSESKDCFNFRALRVWGKTLY
ncbi:MAG: hypothetical protein RL095_3308 [Verrucomicrobiota bacterium]|jgi:hypothetical protein